MPSGECHINSPIDPNTGRAEPIGPSVPPAVQQDLLARLLGTRTRDLDAVQSAHRRLLLEAPELHRRLLRWLAANEPESPHLAVGLAVLSRGPDPHARRFVADLVATLPIRTVADLVDYIKVGGSITGTSSWHRSVRRMTRRLTS